MKHRKNEEKQIIQQEATQYHCYVYNDKSESYTYLVVHLIKILCCSIVVDDDGIMCRLYSHLQNFSFPFN